MDTRNLKELQEAYKRAIEQGNMVSAMYLARAIHSAHKQAEETKGK